MDSVQIYKDYLSSSTPIQPVGDGRNSKRYISSPFKEIDALSPIKSSQKNNFFQDLISLEKNSSHVLTQLKRNKILNGVSRKLRFTEQSNLIDVNSSNNNDSDSGLGSELDSSKPEENSISDRLITDDNCTSLATDDNCNVIRDHIDDSSLNLNVSDLSIFDNENLNLEVLDNRKESYQDYQFKRATLYIDFLKELNQRNCYGVLNLILLYISDDGLQKASCVNREWRNIIANDRVSSERRIQFIKQRKEVASGPNKENRFETKTHIERRHKPTLLKAINCDNVLEQPLVFKQTVGKFDSFIQEAESLPKEGKLTKCPKCLYPSKVHSDDKLVCTRHLCGHEFCNKCMGPYLDNHICASSKPSLGSTKVIISSKQSKKNLKRL